MHFQYCVVGDAVIADTVTIIVCVKNRYIRELNGSLWQIQRILFTHIYYTNDYSNKQECVNISLLLVLNHRR